MSLDFAAIESENIRDDAELVSHVVGRVDAWEQTRDVNHRHRWDEYYRMVRGIPPPHLRKSQASTADTSVAVMPAMQSAVETIVADEEEATFGRKRWLIFEDEDMTELPPEAIDARNRDLGTVNTRFLDDCEEAGVPDAVAEVYLNAAMYGTGIGKVVLKPTLEFTPTDLAGGMVPKEVLRVGIEAVSPYEFVIDPAARTVEDAEGMAHVTMRPLHSVYQKMDDGVYTETLLKPYHGRSAANMAEGAPKSELRKGISALSQEVHLIEYHGLVPARLLGDGDADRAKDDRNQVEAIVTIANRQHVLRAVRNPFPMDDRSFVAFQQDKIPGEFWGRGPTEKGYWSQKVLDAEVDARISALAFSAHPMMVTDITRMAHRGQNLAVRPGRNIYVTGDATGVMTPVKFPAPDPQTYRQSAEMERMLEMATGSLQAATSSVNERSSTATGTTIVQSVGIKRNKRTMRNIENHFLRPFVRKALIRYMEFAPEQYPFFDYQFKVNATMGIVARELEQSQLTGLLSTVPGGSPAFWLILESIYANSSLQDKERLEQVAKAMFQQSVQPQEPERDLAGEARILSIQQRDEAHKADLKFKYDELDAKEDTDSRDRQADLAKTFGK